MRRATRVRVLFAFLFCATTLLLANDTGVTLISQAIVLNSGGFPYKITKPGSYRLASNLIVPANRDGIDINVDNVALDLHGFTISGPITCTGRPVTSCTSGSGVGISSTCCDNITVINGSVVGMLSGVELGGLGSVVEEVHAKFNQFNGIQISGSGRVTHCTAVLNGTMGILADNSVLEGNTVQYNGGTGINAVVGTVIGNSSVSNSQYGLALSNSTFGSNVMFGNGVQDISIGGTDVSQNNNNCSGAAC